VATDSLPIEGKARNFSGTFISSDTRDSIIHLLHETSESVLEPLEGLLSLTSEAMGENGLQDNPRLYQVVRMGHVLHNDALGNLRRVAEAVAALLGKEEASDGGHTENVCPRACRDGMI